MVEGSDTAGFATNDAVDPASDDQGAPGIDPLRLVIILLCAVVVPLGMGSAAWLFNDGDVSWHIATGLWMLTHHAIPTADPFSWTVQGRPWLAIEWGAELLYGAAWRLAGDGGVLALSSAALVALHLVVLDTLRRTAGPVRILATILLMDAVLGPYMLARPHLLAWPLLALWVTALIRARDAGRAPPLLLALVMLAWANLHGSYAIGLALAAVFALEAVVADRWAWATIRAWGLFGLAALAAAICTPTGPAGLLHPLRISTMKTLPLIMEWRPSDWAMTPLFFVAMALVGAMLLWRRVWLRMSVVRLLLLAGLAAMAWMQMRHQAVLAIVAALMLAAPLASPNEQGLDTPTWRSVARVAAALAMVGVIGRALLPYELADNAFHPRRAIAALPPDLRGTHGFNNYSFGGPLILAGIRPYIDGRADLYGDEFAADFWSMQNGDKARFDQLARSGAIRWAMLRPNDRLTKSLAADPAWRPAYADDDAVLFLRREP